MPLSLKLEYSILNDGTRIYVTDKTGEYDATCNTGGWGGANKNLYESCILALVIRKSSGGNQLFEKTASLFYYYQPGALNSYETEFEFVFALDGVLDLCLMRVPVSTNHSTYIDGGSPAEGHYYYYSGSVGDGPGIYKRLGGTYSLVLNDDYVTLPYQVSASVTKTIVTDIATPLLAIEAQKLYKQYRVEREKDCDDAEPLFQEIVKLNEDMRGAYYTFWSNLSTEAQNQVEDLLDKYQIVGN